MPEKYIKLLFKRIFFMYNISIGAEYYQSFGVQNFFDSALFIE